MMSTKPVANQWKLLPRNSLSISRSPNNSAKSNENRYELEGGTTVVNHPAVNRWIFGLLKRGALLNVAWNPRGCIPHALQLICNQPGFLPPLGPRGVPWPELPHLGVIGRLHDFVRILQPNSFVYHFLVGSTLKHAMCFFGLIAIDDLNL